MFEQLEWADVPKLKDYDTYESYIQAKAEYISRLSPSEVLDVLFAEEEA